MEKLIIEHMLNSPGVILDPEKGKYEFSGESRPENARNFYMPVLEWLEKFAADFSKQDPSNRTIPREFQFNFEYFNSTSAKYILDIFKILSNVHSQGINIQVKWLYEADDEDMLEVGMEMSRMSKLPFEYVKIEV
ncbi:MAG: DUF1987 domain-containing protein [Bacteroidales bacterium]|nr:DUF1987 domain-containing protein [Bacteroidales bacterium]